MSVWAGVRLSCAKLTGGTGTSSLDKRFTTQWEHKAAVNTLQLPAPALNPPGFFIKAQKSRCVCVCVRSWMHVCVHLRLYVHKYFVFIRVCFSFVCLLLFFLRAPACASESSWGKLAASTLLRLLVRPWCFLLPPLASPRQNTPHSHRATLRLIAKYTRCCFRCWQQSWLKCLPPRLIGTQQPDTAFYSLTPTFTEQVLIHLLQDDLILVWYQGWRRFCYIYIFFCCVPLINNLSYKEYLMRMRHFPKQFLHILSFFSYKNVMSAGMLLHVVTIFGNSKKKM